MATKTQLMTVEEFSRLAVPAGGNYELHHGEVVFMTYPKWGHEEIQNRIHELLKERAGRQGKVRMEMSFRTLPEHELRRADVGFVRAERARRVEADEYLTGAPDLVVEVLSPGNSAVEMDDKRTICLENGCSSFWVVNPKQKIVSVTEGNTTRHYGLAENIPSTWFGELPVKAIFETDPDA